MPRASSGERRARDALVFSLFVAGKPYRHIGQHSAVQLSVRGVQIAVRPHVAASGGVERLEAMFGDGYQRACGGDASAGVQCGRVLALLGRLQNLKVAGGGGSERPPDANQPRREDVLVVPVGTPRDTVLALARERANTLVGEGEDVGEVRLDASREYDREVEWVFTFTVVP